MKNTEKKVKKIRCWGCGSLDTIKWGKQFDKQRFKCKNCGMLSTRSNVGVSKKNCEIWFREWIVGKQTFSQLSNKNGYSERTLKRMFYSYLERYPEWKIVKRERINLLIDGTYFTNKLCLVLYRENNVKATFFYRLKRALPNMFHYLDNPRIPKTTNALESFFGHLKQNVSLHRGLSKEHYRNYIKWYLFYKSNEK